MRKCYACSGLKYDIDSEMSVCKVCNGTGKKIHKSLEDTVLGSSNCSVCNGNIYSYSMECGYSVTFLLINITRL